MTLKDFYHKASLIANQFFSFLVILMISYVTPVHIFDIFKL